LEKECITGLKKGDSPIGGQSSKKLSLGAESAPHRKQRRKKQ